MTAKTKMALLNSSLLSTVTVGCCLVSDSPTSHAVGWVLIVCPLVFGLEMFATGKTYPGKKF
jgi:hypothetical protein